jgi:hypothetical protein
MSRIDFVTGAPEKYAHFVDSLSTVADRTRAVLAGRTSADLGRDPGGGEWSAQRVLAHMAFYAQANGVFIRQVATMQDPQRRPFPPSYEDPDLVAKDGSSLLDILEEQVGGTAAFLAKTPDASWGRGGYIRGARRSLRQIVDAHIKHLEEHIEQLRGLVG